MWVLCFLISAGFCGYFISKSVNDYLSYEVNTKTQIKYVKKILFPIVTICDLNPYSSPFARKITEKVYNSLPLGLKSYTISKTQLYLEKMKYEKDLYGYKLDEIIVKCFFSSRMCNLINEFEFYLDYNYGACYRFNSGKNFAGRTINKKYVIRNGIWNGLSLELFIGKSSDNQNLFSQSNGFNIFITSEPLDSNSNEGINISPGTSTKIILTKYSQTKQSKPYSECIDNLISVDSYDSDCYKKTMS